MQLAGWVGLVYYLYLIRVGVGNNFLYRGGFTLIAVAIGFVLIAILQTDWLVNRILCLRPMRLLGRVSYGLYIWHLAIFTAVLRYGRWWPPLLEGSVALSLAAVATCGSWFLVERPFLRWKDRMELARHDRDKPTSVPALSHPARP